MLLVKTRSETRREREAAAAAAAKKAAEEESARHAPLDEKTTGNEQKRVGTSSSSTDRIPAVTNSGKKVLSHVAVGKNASEVKKGEKDEEEQRATVVEQKNGRGKGRERRSPTVTLKGAKRGKENSSTVNDASQEEHGGTPVKGEKAKGTERVGVTPSDTPAPTAQNKKSPPARKNTLENSMEDKEGKGKSRAMEKDNEGKESVVGTCSPPGAVAASTDNTKTPNNLEVPKVETAAEKYQKQFAFPCGDPAKRRAEGSQLSSSEKAKRFRGYSSETEYRNLVPYHMQDGVKRLNKELMGFIDDPPGNVTAAPSDDNLYEWQGIISGPKETPYEGGVWLLRLRLPEQYPYRPPEVRFVNKIYHCNIDDEGAICLNILKDEWSAAFTIRSLLLSISALMAAPNPDDPLRQDAAQLLKMDKDEHDRIARRYTLQFATGIKAHIPEAKKKSDGPSKSRAHNDAAASSDGPGSSETSAVDKPKEAAAEPEPNPAREEMFEKARADARNVASADVLEMQGGLTTLELLTRK